MTRTETIIVGGGLAGVSLAAALAASGRDFRLVEARDRLGGRVLTQAAHGAAYDLGPAWFWRGQPRMAALIEQAGLRVFEQHSRGALVFEDERGASRRLPGVAPMRGALRVEGGAAALIDSLSRAAPPDRIATSTRAESIARTASGVVVHTDKGTLEALRVVLALPPRIAATLSFDPIPLENVLASLRSTPTWMAGQAKAIALYETPFWRGAGLSGSAISHRGPMVEVHDASPASEGPYGLFGFIGAPSEARRKTTALNAAIKAQLIRLFGPQAASPIDLFVKDWARDPLTATPLDQSPLAAHPSYGPIDGLWDGAILFGGGEMGREFGGFLEGALEASEAAFQIISGRQERSNEAGHQDSAARRR